MFAKPFTKSSTTFTRCEIGAHFTVVMPFAIGIPLGGTLRLTSYCPKDSFGERNGVKSKWTSVMQRALRVMTVQS